jgi:hypothetical protein
MNATSSERRTQKTSSVLPRRRQGTTDADARGGRIAGGGSPPRAASARS